MEEAVRAGDAAGIPVMVDFGTDHPERPLETLLGEKLRPGDIYTHCFSGNRRELLEDGTPNPGLLAGRERGVVFDVGHGGGSFKWSVAAACLGAGFPADSISTDLHIGSMNAGMQDQVTTMSKFLALGESLDDVIRQSTWNPARQMGREEFGTPVGWGDRRYRGAQEGVPARSASWTASARAKTGPRSWSPR